VPQVKRVVSGKVLGLGRILYIRQYWEWI